MFEEPKIPGQFEVFTLGGESFRLAPLDPISALNGLAVVEQSLLPLIGDLLAMISFDESGKPQVDDTADLTGYLSRVVSTTEQMPKLYDLFSKRCEVLQNGVYASVIGKTTFARRTTLLISWLVVCVRLEYADFLGGSGLALIAETAKALISQLGSAGPSGM